MQASIDKRRLKRFNSISAMQKRVEKLEHFGDYLIYEGDVYTIVGYSLEQVSKDNGLSCNIVYYNRRLDTQIDIDYVDKIVYIGNASIEWSNHIQGIYD